MYCPETIVFDHLRLFIVHHGRGDIRWKLRPLTERWNPLRYEIGLRTSKYGPVRWRINRDGKLATKWSNFTYRTKIAIRKKQP